MNNNNNNNKTNTIVNKRKLNIETDKNTLYIIA